MVISTQHEDGIEQAQIKRLLVPLIEKRRCRPAGCRAEEEIYVNPTGKFVIGGPDGDCGLTGRKIIVDTYGGAAPHGGGAFSGKDPTKVDRSAAYAAAIWRRTWSPRAWPSAATLQISYAIGVSSRCRSTSNCMATRNDVNEAKLEKTLRELVNLSPRGIREHLHLNRPDLRADLGIRPFRP